MQTGEAVHTPTLQVTRLLAPIDGSHLGDLGASVAARLAERIGVGLTVFTASRPTDERRSTDHAAALAARLGAHVSLSIEQSRDAARAIADECARESGSMVCMATHGRNRTSAVMGSVAGGVLRRLDEPVILVGPLAEPVMTGQGDRVVVCLDGTKESERAIGPAVAWAHALGTELALVTVVEPALEREPGAPLHRSHGPEHPHAYLEAVAVRTADQYGVTPTIEVVEDPVSVHAGMNAHLRRHPAALVVTATHRRSGLGRVVIGSEAIGIVHQSPAPVLVVPLTPDG